MQILSPAKLNLCLDIIKKDRSGYHQIQTILHEEKSLYDTIKINKSKEIDNVSTLNSPQKSQKSSTNPKPILNKDNLAFKALRLLKFTYKIKKFAAIKIEKNIPIASGLGGASSNAAAILKGLNKLWKLDLTEQELQNLAAKLGCDVPFFIKGGTAFCTHYGEIIEPLKTINTLKFTTYPKFSPDPLKTKNTYGKLDLKKCGRDVAKTAAFLKALEADNIDQILANMHNDFETLIPISPGLHLCGSGPSTFQAKIP